MDISKIKERCESITPGPWNADCCDGLCPAGIMWDNGPIAHVVVGEWGDPYECLEFEDGTKTGLSDSFEFKKYDKPLRPSRDMLAYGSVDKEWARRNARFIAHARTDIPLLIAEIERLQELVKTS